MAMKPTKYRIDVSFTIHSTSFESSLVRKRISENVRGLLFDPNILGGDDPKTGLSKMNVTLQIDGNITSNVSEKDIVGWLRDVEKSKIDNLAITKTYPDGQRETTYG